MKFTAKKFCSLCCLSTFRFQQLLSKHQILYSEHDVALTKMQSEEEKILTIKNFKHQQQILFIIVADFEAVTKKIDTCKLDSNLSYNMHYQKHENI